MTKVFLLLIVLLAFSSIAFADDIQLGANYHITGCENGELLVPIVHMWEKAGHSHIVGMLSATSNSDKCQGSIVKVLDAKVANGRLRYKVKSLVNRKVVGWVSHFFIGEKAL